MLERDAGRRWDSRVVAAMVAIVREDLAAAAGRPRPATHGEAAEAAGSAL